MTKRQKKINLLLDLYRSLRLYDEHKQEHYFFILTYHSFNGEFIFKSRNDILDLITKVKRS